MKFRISCLLVLVLLFSSAHAQIFKSGALVTHDGDTLRGLVAAQSDNTFVYKPDKKGDRSIYHVDDLAGYQLDDDVFQQHSVEVLRGNFPERVTAYLRVVEDGPLMLLEYTGPSIYGGSHVNYYFYNGSDKPYRINQNPRNFRSTMKLYFRENEELAQKIKSKEYGYDNLKQIAKEYNEWFIEREKNSPTEPEEDDSTEN
jgi:hypothetical protein